MPKVNRNKNNAKLKPNIFTFTFLSSLPLPKKEQHVHGTMVETWFRFPIYWTFIRTNLSFGNICSIDCWEPKHNQSSLELEMVKKETYHHWKVLAKCTPLPFCICLNYWGNPHNFIVRRSLPQNLVGPRHENISTRHWFSSEYSARCVPPQYGRGNI